MRTVPTYPAVFLLEGLDSRQAHQQADVITEIFPNARRRIRRFQQRPHRQPGRWPAAGGVEPVKIIALPAGQADVASQVTQLQSSGAPSSSLPRSGLPRWAPRSCTPLARSTTIRLSSSAALAADAQYDRHSGGCGERDGTLDPYQWFNPAFSRRSPTTRRLSSSQTTSKSTHPDESSAPSLHGYGIARRPNHRAARGRRDLERWIPRVLGDSLSGAENPQGRRRSSEPSPRDPADASSSAVPVEAVRR